jgi:hypothetical protein
MAGAAMIRLNSLTVVCLAGQLFCVGRPQADMLAVCVSDSAANHRCELIRCGSIAVLQAAQVYRKRTLHGHSV